MWVISWNTYPSHGKTVQRLPPNQIEGRGKKHISSNGNQQQKLFLSEERARIAGIPSGFIMSVHFRFLLHFIASKYECICLQWCLFFPAISHCISDKSPSTGTHSISALSHRYTQKGWMQFLKIK